MHQTTALPLLALAFLALAPAAAGASPRWGGWHAGLGVTEARGDDAIAEFGSATGTPSGYTDGWDLDATSARAWIGHDWTPGGWVLGLEASLSGAGGEGGTSTARSEIERQWSLLGRVGRPLGPVLPWVATGWSEVDYALTYTAGSTRERFSPDGDALTWAAGLDWALGERWWLRLSWQRTDLGRVRVRPVTSYPGFDYTQDAVAETWMLGAGLRW
jgi:opacity protein-like surface antigen